MKPASAAKSKTRIIQELLIEIFYYAGEADKENRMNEVAASATYTALPALTKKTKRQACFSALFQEPKFSFTTFLHFQRNKCSTLLSDIFPMFKAKKTTYPKENPRIP